MTILCIVIGIVVIVAAVVYVRRPAPIVCGLLGSALPNDTSSAEIVNPVAMLGGRLPRGQLVGHDVFTSKGFRAPACVRCVAVWNKASQQYEFIDAEGSC